jgi:hypothetical protein
MAAKFLELHRRATGDLHDLRVRPRIAERGAAGDAQAGKWCAPR